MSKARTSLVRTGAVHFALIAYTLVALFPGFLTIVNSFKSRNAIFREPLAIPTPETFSMIGYQTVLRQGDFIGYFQNSVIVTVVSIALVLLFGATKLPEIARNLGLRESHVHDVIITKEAPNYRVE